MTSAPSNFTPSPSAAIVANNGGQWIHRDAEDFEQAITYMRKYTALHQVRIHGWSLMKQSQPLDL